MSDILNCGQAQQKEELVHFSYKCPKSWDDLETTADDSVRFCEVCEKNVFYCIDKPEAEQHARQGQCIAIAAPLAKTVSEQQL